MTEWITPIFDRTPADVTRSKLKVKEWINAFAQGEEVKTYDLKGYINASDLNRIEYNTKYLSEASKLSLSFKTNWSRTDLPTLPDIQRIIDNINKLINEFGLASLTYEMPNSILKYTDANTIEHNLSLIKYMIEDMSERVYVNFTKNICIVHMITRLNFTSPFKSPYERINVAPIIKATDSKSIIFMADYDKINGKLLNHTVNSSTKSIKMLETVSFLAKFKLNNKYSNPVIINTMCKFGITTDFNNPLVCSIKQELSLIAMNVLSNTLVAPSMFMQLKNKVTSSLNIDINIRLLESNNICLKSKTNLELNRVKLSFANMFAIARYSPISMTAMSSALLSTSTIISGMFGCNSKIEMNIGLYHFATLQQFATASLEDMDNLMLENFSYIEI